MPKTPLKPFKISFFFLSASIFMGLFCPNFLGGFEGYDPHSRSLPPQGKVSAVLDGKTLVFTSGQKFSLLGIKILDRRKAMDYLKKTLIGQLVSLQYDQEPKDKFGKLQGYVSLNEEVINRKLIEQGIAEIYMEPPNTRLKHLLVEPSPPPQETSYEEDYHQEMLGRIKNQYYLMLASLFGALLLGFILRRIFRKS